ncbi:MAG: methionine--tRNA ligase [Patescibacteria group bacterium]
MAEKKAFYITSTLPYLNADPHIGHATEFVQTDIIARYKRLTGHDVFFNTGSDEHGLKIFRKAFDIQMDVKDYVDLYVFRFKVLKDSLNLSYDNFVRTTDPHHIKAAQAFWNICLENDDIYKKEYKAKYCVGCEMEKSDSELQDGRCFLHPDLELEIIDEINYFFKFSRFQGPLLRLYAEHPDLVIPGTRLNEIKSFVERGLEDFSVSRLKTKMPWGVSVPNDPEHVMYVWFDALVSYISSLGWPESREKFEKYWVNGTTVQYCGKDNLRQQSAIWQAMLLSAGLPNTNHIIIHGHATIDGQKMSKSLGNIINPLEFVEEYGTDALRYYVAREINCFEDSDISREKFKESYNSNLANGLGNLVSRIMTLAEAHLPGPVVITEREDMSEYFAFLEKFEINKATNHVWEKIGELDAMIQTKKPWESKDPEVIGDMATRLYSIAKMLSPIMPETSDKIKALVKANKKPTTPLFIRKDA